MGGNVEFVHLHSEACFFQLSLEVKTASKTQEKVAYGVFIHIEMKYLDNEELHIIHIVISEL